MKNSRKKEHSLNALIETTEKLSKWSAVFSAITFFVGYIMCLTLDIRDKKQRNKK